MDKNQSLGVVQSDNSINGDMAGRDITKNYFTENKSALRLLAESYKAEIEEDCDQQKFIEELKDFMKRIPNETRNLEQKLSAAERDDLIDRAKDLKERFSKKLYKHTFSPKAQELFVQILSKINCLFMQKVKPMITENQSNTTIDNAIYDEILEPIFNEVGNSKLNIDMNYIHGMLYYLTGNCYIQWD